MLLDRQFAMLDNPQGADERCYLPTDTAADRRAAAINRQPRFLMSTDLLALLDRLAAPRLLVIGDFLLDRYTWGNAERISPEAPVMVLRADRQESRPGGAGSVCTMLRGLGAQAVAVGKIGPDDAGRQLRALLDAAGVDVAGLLTESSAQTTVKERFIGRAAQRHAHQILRVDYESPQRSDPKMQAGLLAAALEAVAGCQAVLIADYRQGLCTPELLAAVIAAARTSGVPLLVDPARGCDYTAYRGASVLTPNRLEAEFATGITINTPGEALQAAEQIRSQWELSAAVITLDRDGMALAEANGHQAVYPTQARDVYDITGAGDMVLATLGLALARGESLPTAVTLANVTAGLKIEKFGAVPVARDEIRLALLRSAASVGKQVSQEMIQRLAETHRRQGQTIVFTNGCFDLLHVGHVRYLEEAAAMGDVFVVAINSDASVRALKGPGRPVIHEADRARLLAALTCIDYVLVFDDATPHELLRRIRPDVLVKGGTYRLEEVIGREIVESYGGKVCLTGMTEGVSTSAIVASLRANA